MMSSTIEKIDVYGLKRLLCDLKEHGHGVGIRFRLLGELWHNQSSKVFKISENGVALIEEQTNRLIFIQEVNNVIHFEIDQPFQTYRPHFHYSVKIP